MSNSGKESSYSKSLASKWQKHNEQDQEQFNQAGEVNREYSLKARWKGLHFTLIAVGY